MDGVWRRERSNCTDFSFFFSLSGGPGHYFVGDYDQSIHIRVIRDTSVLCQRNLRLRMSPAVWNFLVIPARTHSFFFFCSGYAVRGSLGIATSVSCIIQLDVKRSDVLTLFCHIKISVLYISLKQRLRQWRAELLKWYN